MRGRLTTTCNRSQDDVAREPFEAITAEWAMREQGGCRCRDSTRRRRCGGSRRRGARVSPARMQLDFGLRYADLAKGDVAQPHVAVHPSSFSLASARTEVASDVFGSTT